MDITGQCIDTWKPKQAPAEVSHIAPDNHMRDAPTEILLNINYLCAPDENL